MRVKSLRIIYHRLRLRIVLPKLLPEEVNDARRLTHFESSVLIVVHAVPRMLTAHRQILPAIYVDYLASNLIRVLRGQMDDCVAHFLDLGSAAHRIGVTLLLHH